MCDKGRANYNVIKNVYGEEFCAERVQWCQFHLKNSVNQLSNKMSNDDQGTFKHIYKKLCEVTTVVMYYVLKECLDEMSKKYVFLELWIDWWHERHSHILGPFRGGGLPGVNLSRARELKMGEIKHMHLVHVAHDDVATMIVQLEAIYEFDRNISKSGSQGPSIAEHTAKDKSQQIDVAVDFVNIRDNLESIHMQASEANNPTS